MKSPKPIYTKISLENILSRLETTDHAPVKLIFLLLYILGASDQDSSQNVQKQEDQFDRCVVDGIQSGQDVLQTDFGRIEFRGFHVFPPG